MTKPDYINYINAHLDKSLVIIGMMGAGKTTLGKALAKALNIPFHDSDLAIEKDTGLSVSAIFETQGEAVFRQKEKDKIAELLHGPKGVISVGGGAITNAETLQTILLKSVCLWVDAPIDILAKRTSVQGRRPLLNGVDPETALSERMAQRRNMYEKAHLKIDGSLPINKVADNAVGQIYQYLIEISP